jgi:diaminopimelate decarboxylase
MASNYNAVLRPAVVFVRDGQARVVVRRETFADLVARDVVADVAPDGAREGD